MAQEVKKSGFVEESIEIDGAIGSMEVITSDLTDAIITKSGRVIKKVSIDGIEGVIPVVSLQDSEIEIPNLQQVTDKGTETTNTIKANAFVGTFGFMSIIDMNKLMPMAGFYALVAINITAGVPGDGRGMGTRLQRLDGNISTTLQVIYDTWIDISGNKYERKSIGNGASIIWGTWTLK